MKFAPFIRSSFEKKKQFEHQINASEVSNLSFLENFTNNIKISLENFGYIEDDRKFRLGMVQRDNQIRFS